MHQFRKALNIRCASLALVGLFGRLHLCPRFDSFCYQVDKANTDESCEPARFRHLLPASRPRSSTFLNEFEVVRVVALAPMRRTVRNIRNLVANLRAAGYQPEQVDDIYIMHMHPDHIGGLSSNAALFPNAIVHADNRDAEYWLNQAVMDEAPEVHKGYLQGAMNTVGQYAQAGRLQTFDGDHQLEPVIKAVSNYSHTPGNTTYVIESNG